MPSKLPKEVVKTHQKEYARLYYIRNRERIKARVKNWRNTRPGQREYEREYGNRYREKNPLPVQRNREKCRKFREMANSLKDFKPCTDCSLTYPYYVMDWDHVRGTKKSDVSQLLPWCNLELLLKEIAKCELVCANCHRIRTHANKRQSK